MIPIVYINDIINTLDKFQRVNIIQNVLDSESMLVHKNEIAEIKTIL